MTDEFSIAFDLASGRDAARTPGVPPELLAFARRVVAAGRRALASPACPQALLRRAAELADGRGSRRGIEPIAVWKMLFDSWTSAGAKAAMRGGARSRFLRYESASATLDVEMVVGEAGSLGVRGTADGVPAKTTLQLTPSRGRSIRVAVRAGGAFAATLPRASGGFTIEVRTGRRSLGRTPRIPPPAP